MCPNRFVPLYKKFKIYKEQGDTAMIENIGNEILTKKIKVHSHKIDIINNNVRFEIHINGGLLVKGVLYKLKNIARSKKTGNKCNIYGKSAYLCNR